MDINSLSNIGSLRGFNIIEDLDMVDFYGEKIKRGWRERLFSFSPFTKYKIVQKSKPKQKVFVSQKNLIMHPEIAKKLLSELEAKSNGH